MSIKAGKYIHYEGNEYEVTGSATHSETLEEIVLYYKLGAESEIWACPVSAWNGTVNQNGNQVKRFIHVDEATKIPAEPLPKLPVPVEIHMRSDPIEKVELFLSLFTGREDVYAKRWENAHKSKSGYGPACYSEWSPLCPKSGGGKMKCGVCPKQRFIPFSAQIVENHLTGQLTAGVYPMLPDETCRFLAFDFDGKDYTIDVLRRDVSVIRGVCAEKGISMAVERSRSGNGIHFWLFFSENIPASVARKFGSSLITYAMNKNHTLTFETYDRLIPSQDTMPKGGFGNLIALPLQKLPREQGNSIFVDENLNAYDDQWNYLYNIKKYTLQEVEDFTRQLSPTSELGVLQKDIEGEKPWERKKHEIKLAASDFPDTVKVVRANMLYIEKAGISSPALNAIKRLAAFHNPEFYKAQAMRKSTHDKPRVISCFDETEQYMMLPRGLEDNVCLLLEDNGVKITHCDEVNAGNEIDVSFNGALRGEQQQASDALLAHNNGILSATTAFGKTVVGAYLIASRKVNTLVLVHRTNLLTQWLERLNEFLIIREEPPVRTTPTGRIKEKSVIGQFSGGKDETSGIIDVAVMQSLVSKDEVKELVQDYGMVIVDECHHVSAVSFEKILKSVNAKYVYGLTATPTRKDGHHPIIYMYCGKIRYRDDAKKQAEERPFDHYIIPRFTRFQKPAHQDEESWEFTDICGDIQNNELRNSLIVQDAVSAVERGRSPIILTERTEHVKYLAEMLTPHVNNVIVLTGGSTQKQSRETLQSVASIPLDEPFILVATGKYVGEGFDMPRLDTLFLAMPISWKGTLQQYAGRLHRLYDGKNEVQIYDYVDIYVPMLEGMYQKRLKGYASIGYKAKSDVQPIEEVHCIFDSSTFFPVYSADILAARSEVLIVSPFLTNSRVSSALSYLFADKAIVTVVTKPPEDYKDEDKPKIKECIGMLMEHNITVKTKSRIHQKFAVMDQHIVWYGSINLLSYGISEESIMRIDSVDIAGELLRSINIG